MFDLDQVGPLRVVGLPDARLGSVVAVALTDPADLARVWVVGSGHTAKVPAITGGEQRQQPDGRMLGGVGGSGNVPLVDAGIHYRRCRQSPPHGVRSKLLHGHVEGLFAEALPVGSSALERHDLRTHVDDATVKNAVG